MRTIRIKAYKFNELSSEAKETVLESMYDINVMNKWWDSVYEDAENAGLKITSFMINERNYCTAKFINDAVSTAEYILQNHGETTETYKNALIFADRVREIEAKAKLEGKDGDEDYWFDDETEEIESSFLSSLCNDYLKILHNEYEYLTSREAIIETIEANEYEFTKDGKQI